MARSLAQATIPALGPRAAIVPFTYPVAVHYTQLLHVQALVYIVVLYNNALENRDRYRGLACVVRYGV